MRRGVARPRRLEVCDVAARVARHVDHVELERGRADAHALAARHAERDVLDRLVRGAEHRDRLAFARAREQLGHSADVVAVVVRE